MLVEHYGFDLLRLVIGQETCAMYLTNQMQNKTNDYFDTYSRFPRLEPFTCIQSEFSSASCHLFVIYSSSYFCSGLKKHETRPQCALIGNELVRLKDT